jgi:hypothetical protein
MPNIIDLSTPEKLEAFGYAMQAAARTGKPVSLADVAEASGTLEGRKVCYETEHYQITDAGEPTTEWERRWQYRFSMSRKPEFAKSRVLDFPLRSSRVCAEDLLDSLEEAEKFHMINLPFCGGF